MLGPSGAYAQETGGSNPVSFLTEMLGIRSRPAAPMTITAPVPDKAKAGAPLATSKAADKKKAASAPAKATAKAAARKPADKAVASGSDPATGDGVKTASAQPTDSKTVDAQASVPEQPIERKPVKLPPFRGGGSQAVCVRTCDGFFFPVNYEGAHSNDRYAEACQLACPAAVTEVYFMPRGGDLKQASTQRGERYSALPAAFKYRKERDDSCSCKAQSQSWGEVLAQAEPLIKQNPKDIVVTPARSAELARPADPAPQADTAEASKPQKTAAKPRKQPVATAKAKTTPQQALPKQTWQTTNRFVRIDPEPTASIR